MFMQLINQIVLMVILIFNKLKPTCEKHRLDFNVQIVKISKLFVQRVL